MAALSSIQFLGLVVLKQLFREMEPVLAVVCPLGHWRQDREPGRGWYWPWLQSWQSPTVQLDRNLPTEQAVHSASNTEPLLAVVCPTGHFLQETAAGRGWYWLTGQETQQDLASSKKDPGWIEVQL
jgi:hypothetical protein